jgi:hypothetical protein
LVLAFQQVSTKILSTGGNLGEEILRLILK